MGSAIANERPHRRGAVRRKIAVLSAALVIGAAGAEARADASAADKAAAETLFDDGRRLVKEGKYGEACPKLAESLRLDAGIGTMLYLADCYEKNGQPASAWAQFREAAATARAAGQPDREKKARDRVAVLEPKLSRLSIGVVSSAETSGLEVRRDGVVISRPLWGAAVPVDPGHHVIEATAPGKKRWSTKVTIVANAAATLVVEVPPLERDTTPSAEPPKSDGTVAPPKSDGTVAPPKSDGTAAPPRSGPSGESNGVRVLGFTLLGVGAAALVGGAVTGGLAISFNSQSKKNGCTPNNSLCARDGKTFRDTAITLAKVTNGALIAGGILATSGMITVLVTGNGKPEAEKKAVRVSPIAGAGTAGLLLEGVW